MDTALAEVTASDTQSLDAQPAELQHHAEPLADPLSDPLGDGGDDGDVQFYLAGVPDFPDA